MKVYLVMYIANNPGRTVPEPSSLWLLGVGAALAIRNTLYAALTVALVSVGRMLGMRLDTAGLQELVMWNYDRGNYTDARGVEDELEWRE